MDEIVHRLARELADAIAVSVAADPNVAACRERARRAGFEMRVSLEAVIGFAARAAGGRGPGLTVATRGAAERRGLEISAHDRRFLRSLRIAADETHEEVE